MQTLPPKGRLRAKAARTNPREARETHGAVLLEPVDQVTETNVAFVLGRHRFSEAVSTDGSLHAGGRDSDRARELLRH